MFLFDSEKRRKKIFLVWASPFFEGTLIEFNIPFWVRFLGSKFTHSPGIIFNHSFESLKHFPYEFVEGER